MHPRIGAWETTPNFQVIYSSLLGCRFKRHRRWHGYLSYNCIGSTTSKVKNDKTWVCDCLITRSIYDIIQIRCIIWTVRNPTSNVLLLSDALCHLHYLESSSGVLYLRRSNGRIQRIIGIKSTSSKSQIRILIKDSTKDSTASIQHTLWALKLHFTLIRKPTG